MNLQPSNPHSPRIFRLVRDRNLAGLIKLLRQPADAGLRAQAAKALADLAEFDATESLIRSLLEDPEPDVRATARQSLQSLLGNQAELAIQAYRSGSPENDPWLIEPTEEAETNQDSGLDEIEAGDLDGLIQVARYESSSALRVRAIQWLSRSSDMRATETLAYLAQYDDSLPLRAAALQALTDRYGPQAEEILASYRVFSLDEDEVEDGLEGELDGGDFDEEFAVEEDEILEDEPEDADSESSEAISPYPRSGSFQDTRPRQGETRPQAVVEEISFPWRALVLIVFLVIIVTIILLLVR